MSVLDVLGTRELWFCRAFSGCASACPVAWLWEKEGGLLPGKKTKKSQDFLYFSFLVLSMLHNPLGSVLGKPPLSFLPLDPLGCDVDKFPAPSVRGSRVDTRPILDSRSCSPSDSDTSGLSSGSDHFSDLIVCRLLGVGVGGRASVLGRGHVLLGCWEVWRPSWAHTELFVLDRIGDALYTHHWAMHFRT